MNYFKKIFWFLVFFYSAMYYPKLYQKDTLKGEYTYNLKAKFDTRINKYYEELFVLKVGVKTAFFASIVSLKGDSVMAKSGTTTHNADGSITLGWKQE